MQAWFLQRHMALSECVISSLEAISALPYMAA
jgi:hypothetical protein